MSEQVNATLRVLVHWTTLERRAHKHCYGCVEITLLNNRLAHTRPEGSPDRRYGILL